MILSKYNEILNTELNDEELLDFCRKHIVHGTPAIFIKREDDYYEFRKKISENFEILFQDVFITGSAKLGFSPIKDKTFDYDSDVDVVIISQELFDRIMALISDFQMEVRKNRMAVTEGEMEMYHKFLEYVALGWIRPDKLPTSFKMSKIKDEWFEFFRTLSNGKSEVGNYKVNAGIFKSYIHFERYIFDGIKTHYLKELNKL